MHKSDYQITYRHSITINKPAETVWDYTQDYSNRTQWDSSVLETVVLQESPHRIVKLKMKGGTDMTFIYKLDERPLKTSLATGEVISRFIDSAGGYWTYERQGLQTIWTQTNTLVFKKQLLLKLLLPFYKWLFARLTLKAMLKAKVQIEKL